MKINILFQCFKWVAGLCGLSIVVIPVLSLAYDIKPQAASASTTASVTNSGNDRILTAAIGSTKINYKITDPSTNNGLIHIEACYDSTANCGSSTTNPWVPVVNGMGPRIQHDFDSFKDLSKLYDPQDFAGNSVTDSIVDCDPGTGGTQSLCTSGNTVVSDIKFTLSGQNMTIHYVFSIVGYSLKIDVTSDHSSDNSGTFGNDSVNDDEEGIVGVNTGWAEAPSTVSSTNYNGVVGNIPYMPEGVAIFAKNSGTIIGASTVYIDPAQSNASEIKRGVAAFDNDSNTVYGPGDELYAHGRSLYYPETEANGGDFNDIDEVVYVTYADNLSDLYPKAGLSSSKEEGDQDFRERLVMDAGNHQLYFGHNAIALDWTAPAEPVSGDYTNAEPRLEVATTSGAGSSADNFHVLLIHIDDDTADETVLLDLIVEEGDSATTYNAADTTFDEGDIFRTELIKLDEDAADPEINFKFIVDTENAGKVLTNSDPGDGDYTNSEYKRIEVFFGAELNMTSDSCANTCWESPLNPDSGAYVDDTVYTAGNPSFSETPTFDGYKLTDWLRNYSNGQRMIEQFSEYGMDELAIVYHEWQTSGVDRDYPYQYPFEDGDTRTHTGFSSFEDDGYGGPAAGSIGKYGSVAEIDDMIEAAADKDILLFLHLNFSDCARTGASTDCVKAAKDSDGNGKMIFDDFGHGMNVMSIADRQTAFDDEDASIDTENLDDVYDNTGFYLDVIAALPLTTALDFDDLSDVNTLSEAYTETVELIESVKARSRRLTSNTKNDIVVGEGRDKNDRSDSYFAGAYDGTEREIEGRVYADILPEYELEVIRPDMFNHGMGYYRRYFNQTDNRGGTELDVSLQMAADYRASQMAYGHAGLLSDRFVLHTGVDYMDMYSMDYWLMRALQEQYKDADVSTITFVDESNTDITSDSLTMLFKDLKGNLKANDSRVRIEYANGLKVYINRGFPEDIYNSVSDFSPYRFAGGAGMTYRDWRYYHDNGSYLLHMNWDINEERWVHDNLTSTFISQAEKTYILPSTGSLTRRLILPSDSYVEIAVDVKMQEIAGTCDDMGGSGATDGITVSVENAAYVSWGTPLTGATCTVYDTGLETGKNEECSFTFSNFGEESGLKNADLYFVLERGSTNECTAVNMAATVVVDSTDDGLWDAGDIDSDGYNEIIPPGGFYAYCDTSGSYTCDADFVAYSLHDDSNTSGTTSDDVINNYVESDLTGADYTYNSSYNYEDGQDETTDPSLIQYVVMADVEGYGNEIHVLNYLNEDSANVVLDDRADFNARFDSTNSDEVYFTVRDIDGGALKTDVLWKNAALPGGSGSTHNWKTCSSFSATPDNVSVSYVGVDNDIDVVDLMDGVTYKITCN